MGKIDGYFVNERKIVATIKIVVQEHQRIKHIKNALPIDQFSFIKSIDENSLLFSYSEINNNGTCQEVKARLMSKLSQILKYDTYVTYSVDEIVEKCCYEMRDENGNPIEKEKL